jgi:hypothetical protein
MPRGRGELSCPRISPSRPVYLPWRTDAKCSFRRSNEHSVAHLPPGVAVPSVQAPPQPEAPNLELGQFLRNLSPETSFRRFPISPLPPAARKHPELVFAATDQKNLPSSVAYGNELCRPEHMEMIAIRASIATVVQDNGASGRWRENGRAPGSLCVGFRTLERMVPV